MSEADKRLQLMREKLARGEIRIEKAESTGVDTYHAVAEDFLRRIFDLDCSTVLLTDESSLSDFKTCNDLDTVAQIKDRIREVYGLAEVPDNLFQILVAISEKAGHGKVS